MQTKWNKRLNIEKRHFLKVPLILSPIAVLEQVLFRFSSTVPVPVIAEESHENFSNFNPMSAGILVWKGQKANIKINQNLN